MDSADPCPLEEASQKCALQKVSHWHHLPLQRAALIILGRKQDSRKEMKDNFKSVEKLYRAKKPMYWLVSCIQDFSFKIDIHKMCRGNYERFALKGYNVLPLRFS